jgi:hypothetical protein
MDSCADYDDGEALPAGDDPKCKSWAAAGRCTTSTAIRNLCRRSCGLCGPAGSVTKVATGKWDLVMSHTNGGLEFAIEEGTSTETGQTLSTEFSRTLGVSVEVGMEFEMPFGPSGSVAMSVSEEVSSSIGREVSSSFVKEVAKGETVECQTDGENPSSTAWLYQFVIQYDGAVVRTPQTRCHVTPGDKEMPPKCPLGLCINSDPLCQTCSASWEK